MNNNMAQPILSAIISFLLCFAVALANAAPRQNSTTTSPWLNRFDQSPAQHLNQRGPGCWNRPWICNRGQSPPRLRNQCCRNRCVDVSSDVNNCGVCGFRCPFGGRCCRGFCVNINTDPFNCGTCGNRCPFRTYCIYGMCGYGQSSPDPRPRWPPRDPHPPHDPRPHPPHHGPRHGDLPPSSG